MWKPILHNYISSHQTVRTDGKENNKTCVCVRGGVLLPYEFYWGGYHSDFIDLLNDTYQYYYQCCYPYVGVK